MISVMEIDGYQAVIKYDPEIGLFQGEFIGLNGGAGFMLPLSRGSAEKEGNPLRFS